MKKNALGRVPLHKEPFGRRISALHIPARLLCLLLAIIIWLAIVNIDASNNQDASGKDTKQQTEETE